MRFAHTLLSGFTLTAVAFVAGCTGATSDGATGSSQARLVVSSTGQQTATLRVTAVEDATADTVVDQTITVAAGSAQVVSLSLDPSGYTFAVDVLGAGDAKLGSTSAHVNLEQGVLTQIALTADVDGASNAQVNIGVDTAPQIEGVKVSLDGDTVNVHIDASDDGGGDLSFFWSGAGLSGAVQGSSTLSIPSAAVAANSMVHVVVQDAHGVASSADIALATAGGDVQGAMFGEASAAACLDAQAQCNATCGSATVLGAVTSADVSCLAGCSLTLAQCEAQ
jgi:hypothetical protein